MSSSIRIEDISDKRLLEATTELDAAIGRAMSSANFVGFGRFMLEQAFLSIETNAEGHGGKMGAGLMWKNVRRREAN